MTPPTLRCSTWPRAPSWPSRTGGCWPGTWPGSWRAAASTDIDWDTALAAYDAVRPEHCRRVITTGRLWGELWHHDGLKRLQRNAILRARDPYDYTFTEWIFGPTALTPQDEAELYPVIPLSSVDVSAEESDESGLFSAG